MNLRAPKGAIDAKLKEIVEVIYFFEIFLISAPNGDQSYHKI